MQVQAEATNRSSGDRNPSGPPNSSRGALQVSLPLYHESHLFSSDPFRLRIVGIPILPHLPPLTFCSLCHFPQGPPEPSKQPFVPFVPKSPLKSRPMRLVPWAGYSERPLICRMACSSDLPSVRWTSTSASEKTFLILPKLLGKRRRFTCVHTEAVGQFLVAQFQIVLLVVPLNHWY